MQRIIMATGQSNIDRAVATIPDVQVLGALKIREQVPQAVSKITPDILIYAEVLPTEKNIDSVELLVAVKKRFPSIRIIYLPGPMYPEKEKDVERITKLAQVGIFDIFTKNGLNLSILRQYIEEPNTIENLEAFIQPKKKTQTMNENTKTLEEVKPRFKENQNSNIGSASINAYVSKEEAKHLSREVMAEVTSDVENENILRSVYIISSIKPGTGKSFLSTNIATAISEYGQVGPNGEKPRVAIVEGDLQNLSIGTLLSVEDDKYNLKTAIEKIDTLLDPSKNKDEWRTDIEAYELDEVDRTIMKCFQPYYKANNLFVLVGSQFESRELEMVKGNHYVYLLETISKLFDVVIVDTNSSLNHVTTYPLLQLANQCYYVLNLDYNNIRNNHRYRQELVDLGIGDKVKYILNEDISQNMDNKEELIFKPEDLIESGYRLEGCIPEIDKSIFLNRLHEGSPVILDNSKSTLKARYEISKIADSIWPMDNLVELEHEWNKHYASQIQKKTAKKKFKFFS